MNHWTQSSVSDFVYSLSLDFFTQLEDQIFDAKLQKKQIAERLEVTPSAVSQMLNSPPAKPELETLVKYALAAGAKVSVVLYNDNDPRNERGPVYSGIFAEAWTALNKPRDKESVEAGISGTFFPRFKSMPEDQQSQKVNYGAQGTVAVNLERDAFGLWQSPRRETGSITAGKGKAA